MKGPTPSGLWQYAARRLRLAAYFRAPGDGRWSPQIPAKALLGSIVMGFILRQSAFRAIEALVGSRARPALPVRRGFGDDALRYFTERLRPAPPRAALASVLRRAKRNKAFEGCRFVGVALDGTTGGRRRKSKSSCGLCRPYRHAAHQIVGYRHHLVLAAVSPSRSMSNPTDRATVNRRPDSVCCAACAPAWERASSITWWWTENLPPRLFCPRPARWAGPSEGEPARIIPGRPATLPFPSASPRFPRRFGSRAALGRG
jgi:hypothetical protein